MAETKKIQYGEEAMEAAIKSVKEDGNRIYYSTLFYRLTWITAMRKTVDPDEFGVSQYPGGFFIFWNVIVPLSVLINIRRFGLRRHEIALIAALCLNPYLLQYIMRSAVASTLVAIFLMITVERILARWMWYRIYSVSLLKNTALLFILLAISTAFGKLLWIPAINVIRHLLRTSGLMEATAAEVFVDTTFLLVACMFLASAVYTAIKKYKPANPVKPRTCSRKSSHN